jgi:hypothetical protein
LVPLVKGYSTEMSLEVTSLGVQVHGGMGFIEETGAAQYYRDAKILTIYEGTTAIQANDLVGRKTSRDGGQTAKAIAAQVAANRGGFARPRQRLLPWRLPNALKRAGKPLMTWLISRVNAAAHNPNAAYAGSVPYLMLAGNVMAGWQMAQVVLDCPRGSKPRRRRQRFLACQDGHGTLLCRPHPQQSAWDARWHRRWR